MESAPIRVPYRNLKKEIEVEMVGLEMESPNPNSDADLRSQSTKHRSSLITLVLSCTVAAGVQCGWALQLSHLTPYIQTLGIGHAFSSFIRLCGPITGLAPPRLVWATSNFTVFACMAGTAVISWISVGEYSEGIEHVIGGNAPIMIAALTVFALLGFLLAITCSVPFSVTAELTADSGGCRGLAIGVLNPAIVTPQVDEQIMHFFSTFGLKLMNPCHLFYWTPGVLLDFICCNYVPALPFGEIDFRLCLVIAVEI